MVKIIKIGGNVVDNPAALDRFLADFAALEGDKVLVHGGGKIATTISHALGIRTNMIDGRRVTDEETLRVVTMVYGGLVNKTIVAKLQAAGCDAVGLSGADGRLIVSRRRAPEPVDYGFVGDPVSVNVGLLRSLAGQGFTPIVAPITYDSAGGSLLNTNADTVAQTLAVALAGGLAEPQEGADDEVELVYCFEKRGVLRDVNDENSVIPTIGAAEFARLKADGTIADGMIPKLENAFRAIGNGVSRVVICSAEAILQPGYGGTTLIR